MALLVERQPTMQRIHQVTHCALLEQLARPVGWSSAHAHMATAALAGPRWEPTHRQSRQDSGHLITCSPNLQLCAARSGTCAHSPVVRRFNRWWSWGLKGEDDSPRLSIGHALEKIGLEMCLPVFQIGFAGVVSLSTRVPKLRTAWCRATLNLLTWMVGSRKCHSPSCSGATFRWPIILVASRPIIGHSPRIRSVYSIVCTAVGAMHPRWTSVHECRCSPFATTATFRRRDAGFTSDGGLFPTLVNHGPGHPSLD